jgi:hypothetical protein
MHSGGSGRSLSLDGVIIILSLRRACPERSRKDLARADMHLAAQTAPQRARSATIAFEGSSFSIKNLPVSA